MIYLKLAWRNIWRNKRRTLIAVASIFFAVSLSTLMRSMLEGAYGSIVRNVSAFSTGYIQIHKKGYWNEKNIENVMVANNFLLSTVTADEEVTAVLPRIETFALASTGSQSAGIMLLAIDPQAEQQTNKLADRLVGGQYLQQHDEGILLASGVARRLQLAVGDTLVLMTQGLHAASANGLGIVKGIVKLGSPVLDKSMVYMSLSAARQLLSLEDHLSGLSLMVSSTRQLETVKARLQAKIDTSAYEIMDWKEMRPELDQMIEADSGGHRITMAILYVVIAFGIFSTVLMMMAERRHEFAILIAIGLKKYQLALIVCVETVLLLLMGIAAGTLAALPVISYFIQHPIQLSGELREVYESYGFEPVLPVSRQAVVFLSQIRAVLIIGMIVLVYPLVNIARFKLMKAMRA